MSASPWPPPRKLRCAVEAVLDIAYHGGGAPCAGRVLARRQGLAPRYLEKLLQDMVRAGILESLRGPRGGYRLARERRRINLGELARLFGAGDGQGNDSQRSTLEAALLEPLWRGFSQQMLDALDKVTVDDLCRRAQALALPPAAARRLDYSI